MSSLTESAAWLALREHAAQLAEGSIAELFAADAQRPQRFSAEAAGLYLDYSKQHADERALQLLLALAQQQDLPRWIGRMFAGEAINQTENRAVLHVVLRAPRHAPLRVDGQDVPAQVHAVLDRMCDFAEQVRSGSWLGATGRAITDVVNIGIGGSDLGPRMVCRALAAQADGPRVHFVANVDGTQLTSALHGLEPATTLFVITSKMFTTLETMANAGAARRWLVAALGEDAVRRHCVAVSTNRAEVLKFGIDAANVFEFWDWVGGRYSLWSAVGLSIVIAIGAEGFRQLLAGAHAVDEHFRSAPLEQNLPVLLGLLAVWNRNCLASRFGARSQVVAPYAQDLEYFVPWLQQLEMESNGKSVDRQGLPVDYATTPALWGDVGTNGQHAFFQMLHQGPAIHPVDFILPLRAAHPLQDQQRMLIANCLAQSSALMLGKSPQQVRAELQAKGMQGAALEAAVPHRVFAGNRPSNTILLPRLDAWHLGALLALYEHRTFVQSVIWNINAFDQWGVELGKQLAQSVLAAMAGDAQVGLDPSTRTLLARSGQ